MAQLVARDVMTTEVFSAQADWSIERLTEFLVANAISGAPVLSTEGALLGVVSLTDIARSTVSEDAQLPDVHDYFQRSAEAELAPEDLEQLRAFKESSRTVREIMTPLVFDVREDAPVKEIADAMIRGRIHRLIVTREKKVVGVVSALDLLRVLRDM